MKLTGKVTMQNYAVLADPPKSPVLETAQEYAGAHGCGVPRGIPGPASRAGGVEEEATPPRSGVAGSGDHEMITAALLQTPRAPFHRVTPCRPNMAADLRFYADGVERAAHPLLPALGVCKPWTRVRFPSPPQHAQQSLSVGARRRPICKRTAPRRRLPARRSGGQLIANGRIPAQGTVAMTAVVAAAVTLRRRRRI